MRTNKDYRKFYRQMLNDLRSREKEDERNRIYTLKWVRVLAVITITFLLTLIVCRVAQSQEVNMKLIATIESSNNPLAFNRYSQARGLYQITPICLDDYNQYHKVKFTLKELFKADINTLVASWYFQERIPQLLDYYRCKDTLENRLISYHCGIKCVIQEKLGPKTRAYLARYKDLM